MARKIRAIPELYGKEAEDFEKKASANVAKKGSIDFTIEAENAKAILLKAKLK
jgi:hypothetical protein